MRTNYYIKPESMGKCPHCGHEEFSEELHIGKSSMGWCFSLHAIPERGLNNWRNWLVFLEGKTIKDEYGSIYTLDEFSEVVLARGRENYAWEGSPVGYSSWERFHELNGSMEGPRGLIRHKNNAGHGGDEPWDAITGEFS